MKSKLPSYFYLLLVSLIWGYAAVVIKETLTSVTPLVFLLYRFLISAFIALFFLPKKEIISSKKYWPDIILYSFLSTTVSLSLLFVGLNKTSVLTLSLISVLSPLLLSVAAIIFLKERESKKLKLGTMIAFVGAFIAVVAPILDSMRHFGQLEANILIVLSVISDITSVLILKRLVQKGVSPLFLTNVSFAIGLITLLPVALIFYSLPEIINQIKNLSLNYHLGVWYMAIFSGTIAYFLRAKAQKSLKVADVGIFTYLQAIFSIIFAILILKEAITILFIIGAVIIILGILVAETRKFDL